jgi:RND family efflux transporter MFP subunit
MDVPGSSLEEETGETWLRYERRPLIPSRTSRVVEAFTEPYRDIAVAASEMGTLSEIAVQEGQTVRVGDVVAAMDQDVLRAALEVARRSMSSEGALKSAQADLARKAEELSKLTGLKERGHASQQEVDRVDADRQVAEARLLAVREDLEVKQLEARRIEAQIEERIIRSPIDGIVTELRRESGEFVSPSDPVIARVVQLDPLLVVFAVPVEYRDELQAGQSVTVKFGEANPESRTGMIEFVAPTPDPSNSSVRVKVRIANPGRKIRSGERTTLDLDTQQVESSDNQRDMLRPDPQRPESP